MSPARHLVIFAKTPRMGTVKRRLAASLGYCRATSIYRRLLRDIVGRLAFDPRWRCTLAVTPDSDATGPWRWSVTTPRLAQGPGDLGQRMARAAMATLPGPVVIIGSDIPEIRPHHIAEAFEALRRNDIVFGPAADGGYWLVGMSERTRPAWLFRGVRWSTEHALADTMVNLRPNQPVAMLETLEDIDDVSSLARWRAGSRG